MFYFHDVFWNAAWLMNLGFKMFFMFVIQWSCIPFVLMFLGFKFDSHLHICDLMFQDWDANDDGGNGIQIHICLFNFANVQMGFRNCKCAFVIWFLQMFFSIAIPIILIDLMMHYIAWCWWPYVYFPCSWPYFAWCIMPCFSLVTECISNILFSLIRFFLLVYGHVLNSP